jgi:hypothetical protein
MPLRRADDWPDRYRKAIASAAPAAALYPLHVRDSAGSGAGAHTRAESSLRLWRALLHRWLAHGDLTLTLRLRDTLSIADITCHGCNRILPRSIESRSSFDCC